MRLFTAITFPEPVLRGLCLRQEQMRAAAQRGNFSRRDNLHLTLVFLGETAPERVDTIRRIMDAAPKAAFPMTIGAPGRFRGERGDTLWLAIDASEALNALYDHMYKGFREAGFRVENRSYKPHLTLAREFVLRPGADFECLKASFRPIPCYAERLSLMESDRVNGVLTYTELYGKELHR